MGLNSDHNAMALGRNAKSLSLRSLNLKSQFEQKHIIIFILFFNMLLFFGPLIQKSLKSFS